MQSATDLPRGTDDERPSQSSSQPGRPERHSSFSCCASR
jgi:hypothetical protein